jgi:poly(A) polymerase
MKRITDYVRTNQHIQEIYGLRGDREIYLVGGTIRDIMMGNEPQDFDFSVSGSGIEFARSVSRKMRGALVVLDEEEDEARVVRDDVVYDFIGLDAGGVVADLQRRDFTVNAMAVNLQTGEFLDPYDGKKDVKRGIIRPTTAQSLIDDPLRILRGFRFALELDFNLHKDFTKLAKNISLADTAAERIGYEIVRIASAPHSFPIILKINQLGLLKQLFPEAVKLIEDFDLWDHSLGTYGAVERLIERGFFRDLEPEYSQYFARPNRVALCKLAGLFHDVAKPDTFLIKQGEVHFYGHDTMGAKMVEKIGHRRLRFSKHDTEILKKLVKEHMRLHLLATNPDLTDRAIRRFFRHLEEDWFGAMMIAWADGYATGGKTRHLEKAFIRMIELYRADNAKPKVERLVNGHDLIDLGMTPGPLFKIILQELLDLQLEGKVTGKDDALKQAVEIAERLRDEHRVK